MKFLQFEACVWEIRKICTKSSGCTFQNDLYQAEAITRRKQPVDGQRMIENNNNNNNNSTLHQVIQWNVNWWAYLAYNSTIEVGNLEQLCKK